MFDKVSKPGESCKKNILIGKMCLTNETFLRLSWLIGSIWAPRGIAVPNRQLLLFSSFDIPRSGSIKGNDQNQKIIFGFLILYFTKILDGILVKCTSDYSSLISLFWTCYYFPFVIGLDYRTR